MKIKWQHLPSALQGMILGAIWFALTLAFIGYNFPTKQNSTPISFSPFFPLLSRKDGVVTADWTQFSFWFILFLTLYSFFRVILQDRTPYSPQQVLRMMMPLWLFVIVIIFITTFWLPVTGLENLSLFERSSVILGILIFMALFVGSFQLYGEMILYRSKQGRVLKLVCWIVFLFGIIYLVTHVSFTLHGAQILENSFFFGNTDQNSWSVPFWPSWAMGVGLILVSWVAMGSKQVKFRHPHN
ncbi:hypothetical protein [Lacticaseibacillus chiayiensis]|uniref:hypothetical protein n=1 Tax=Lacticaseibacillus chiayiensis TaxID=2100821 RepID=UPI0010111049|nr:hypothetical protein [Lacticaseibacillus chiayiensis]RXT58239.1 hypothetical protein CHT97_07680 [Lacticaseibacillus chiayiensis]